MLTFPLLLTIYAGFTHAFEADHLLAVSSIVSSRNNVLSSMKDGVFWGLGHSSTIFVIGVLMILFRVGISEQTFHYFEALVGVMLITLAVYRLAKFFKKKKVVIHSHGHCHEHDGHNHDHSHLHVHVGDEKHGHSHSLAYSVGLVHGLAGSGALVLIVMTQIRNTVEGLSYLLIFSSGCILGMLVAAGLFSIPFSKRIMQARTLQIVLIVISCTLCLIYGTKSIYDNLTA